MLKHWLISGVGPQVMCDGCPVRHTAGLMQRTRLATLPSGWLYVMKNDSPSEKKSNEVKVAKSLRAVWWLPLGSKVQEKISLMELYIDERLQDVFI